MYLIITLYALSSNLTKANLSFLFLSLIKYVPVTYWIQSNHLYSSSLTFGLKQLLLHEYFFYNDLVSYIRKTLISIKTELFILYNTKLKQVFLCNTKLKPDLNM